MLVGAITLTFMSFSLLKIHWTLIICALVVGVCKSMGLAAYM